MYTPVSYTHLDVYKRQTLYWAEGKVDESALMEEHRFIYASTFAPVKFRRYVRIPFDPNGTPGERVSWQQ